MFEHSALLFKRPLFPLYYSFCFFFSWAFDCKQQLFSFLYPSPFKVLKFSVFLTKRFSLSLFVCVFFVCSFVRLYVDGEIFRAKKLHNVFVCLSFSFCAKHFSLITLTTTPQCKISHFGIMCCRIVKMMEARNTGRSTLVEGVHTRSSHIAGIVSSGAKKHDKPVPRWLTFVPNCRSFRPNLQSGTSINEAPYFWIFTPSWRLEKRTKKIQRTWWDIKPALRTKDTRYRKGQDIALP